MLELVHLTKVFGDCVACADVSLEVGEGEVVAVVGENGAGKSTLMNTACGLYRPTEGKVLMNGKPLELGSTRAAIAAGMGMVHQHFMLVPPLTIAENVALGAEPRRGLAFDRQRAESDVEALSKKLGFALDPQRLIADCSVATQQRVEILKVLYRGAKMLILDEPTAVLAPAEAEALLETVRALAGEGKSIVIISHKLREVLAVAQRVAVMRRGKLVATVEAKETSADELAALMVGGSHHAPRAEDKERPARGERIAHLRGVSARNERGLPALKGLDLELFAGEIVTVAGVDGNGQTELAEVLTGLRSIDEGTLALAPLASSREAVAHIPEDRQRRGLCLSLSVEENLALGRHRARGLVKSGPVERVDAGARAKLAEELMESLDVRPPDASLPASALSGGNQQKVIVARELLATPRLAGAARPALVVAVQPTRGLDLGAIANVHARLREARNAGAAVLVVSMDLDEVRALGDRIVVMADGRIVAELEPGADEALIGRHMLAGGDVRHG